MREIEKRWHTIPGHYTGQKNKWQYFTGLACPHGKEIVLVDGAYVRNTMDSDFVQGGNGYRYRFIPRRELWLDSSMPEDEQDHVAFHECHESEDMKAGMSYDLAHDRAKRREDKMRKRDRPGEKKR